MDKLSLLFGIHDHQPLGNHEHVIEEISRKCYRPFLEKAAARPDFKFAFHASGFLLRWFEEKARPIFDLIGELASRGQIELLLGGFFEPVLASIPRDDRVAQINMMRDYIEAKFGQNPKGLWLTERVWEPGIAEDLVRAGVKYVLVDDRHFLVCGFDRADLHDYYLTEDGGKKLAIFPIDQKLRYLIPFRSPDEIAHHLRSIYDSGKRLAIYVDDGEKFGAWPGTYKWVYEDGWLDRFFEKLDSLLGDFLTMGSFADTIDRRPPAGICYLPSASYTEMEEWSLPAARISALKSLLDKAADQKETYSPLIRGGHWRNFFVKYPEANRMHKKMLRLGGEIKKKGISDPGIIEDYYASQCNDAYWHGTFGGIYLPHLRHEIWRHLACVEKRLRSGQPPTLELTDLDFDGVDEIWIHSHNFSSALKPSRGGQLIEHTLFAPEVNYLNTLARRFEGYHADLTAAAQSRENEAGAESQGVPSIHEIKRSGDEVLKAELIVDAMEKFCFIDHIFSETPDIARYRRCALVDLADFSSGRFDFATEDNFKIILSRTSRLKLGEGLRPELSLIKTFSYCGDGSIKVSYSLTNMSESALSAALGVELNLFPLSIVSWGGSIKAGGEEYALAAEGDLPEIDKFTISDDGARLQLDFALSQKARLLFFPVMTISQSEKGFERTFQCLSLMPCWHMEIAPGKRWEVKIDWNFSKKIDI